MNFRNTIRCFFVIVFGLFGNGASAEPGTPASGVPAAKAAAEFVVKFSHVDAAITAKGQAAEKFKQLAEQYSNGKVQVEVHPNGELFQEINEMDALLKGSVQIIAPSLSTIADLGIKEFYLFDLPYIFPSRELLMRVTEGDTGRSLFKKLPAKNLSGLAFWDNGFRQMCSVTPLSTPEQLSGKKMRIEPSRVLETEMKTLGAKPVQIANTGLAAALARGGLDGMECTLSDYQTLQLQNTFPSVTVTNHGYIGYAVVVNEKYWKSLPEDIRDALTQAMKEATDFQRALAAQMNESALAALSTSDNAKVATVTQRERIKWQSAMLPVFQVYENMVGKMLIKSVAYTAQQIFKEQKEAQRKEKAAGK